MKLHRYLKANPLKLALLAHRGCLFQNPKTKKNWVIATNSDCVILILLQPEWCEIKQSKFEIQKVLPYGCKEIGIRKSEFVARTCINNPSIYSSKCT